MYLTGSPISESTEIYMSNLSFASKSFLVSPVMLSPLNCLVEMIGKLVKSSGSYSGDENYTS
jgi:hypothetical protein